MDSIEKYYGYYSTIPGRNPDELLSNVCEPEDVESTPLDLKIFYDEEDKKSYIDIHANGIIHSFWLLCCEPTIDGPKIAFDTNDLFMNRGEGYLLFEDDRITLSLKCNKIEEEGVLYLYKKYSLHKISDDSSIRLR